MEHPVVIKGLALALAVLFHVATLAPEPTKERKLALRVIELSNGERAKQGLSKVIEQANLTRAALQLATDLASRQILEHRDGQGRRLSARVEAAGYLGWTAIAENIAYGQESAAEVVDGWMHSEGHRANLLGAPYREIGVAVAPARDGTLYWVQIFGAR